MKPLLVGEDNPHSTDPRLALFPYPKSAAGYRLCGITGLTRAAYLRTFDRANLCSPTWNLREARMEALRLTRYSNTNGHRTFVLLGARVASAFRAPFEPFTIKHGALWEGTMHDIVILPHPSGRCREWNDPTSIERARATLREARVLPKVTRP